MAIARLIRLDDTGHTVLTKWKVEGITLDDPAAVDVHVSAAEAIIRDHSARGYMAVDQTGARVGETIAPHVRQVTLVPRLEGG